MCIFNRDNSHRRSYHAQSEVCAGIIPLLGEVQGRRNVRSGSKPDPAELMISGLRRIPRNMGGGLRPPYRGLRAIGFVHQLKVEYQRKPDPTDAGRLYGCSSVLRRGDERSSCLRTIPCTARRDFPGSTVKRNKRQSAGVLMPRRISPQMAAFRYDRGFRFDVKGDFGIKMANFDP